jgi:DNA polymerase I
MSAGDVVSLDSETERFGPCNMAPRLVCVSYAFEHEHGLLGWRDARDFLVWVLRSDLRIVGHGVAYDFLVWLAMWPDLWDLVVEAYEADRIEDTEIRQELLDIAGGVYRRYLRTDGQVVKIGYSLEDLALRHLGVQLDKEADGWRTRYGELRDVPVELWPERARKYAIDDAVSPLRIHAVQEANAAYLKDQYRQARAALWLKAMSTWGVITDPVAVREYERRAQTESARLSKMLEAAGLKRPDRVLKAGKNKGTIKEGARDMEVVRRLVTEAYGGKPPLTDTGLACTDEATCSGSGNKLLEAYAEFSSIMKMLSTDVPLLKAGTQHPIHAYFEVLKETGRTGTSSPNLQNLPRREGVRECLVPRPGCVFAAADYTGMELRTWAQACIKIVGFSDMAAVLNAGGDPHLEIAAALLGIPYANAVATKGDDDVDNARQVGKVGNFGFQGGMGADSLVEYAWANYGVRIVREQAVQLKEVWRRRWREARPYLAFISDLTDRPDAMVCHLGSERYRGGVTYTEAANSWFQGLAADAAKAAGWLIFKACYAQRDSVLYGSRPVLFIHDEFVLEVPEERGHECAVELARLMVEGAAPWLPDVPPKAEPVLMRRYSKKAKPVRVNGRLQVWEK